MDVEATKLTCQGDSTENWLVWSENEKHIYAMRTNGNQVKVVSDDIATALPEYGANKISIGPITGVGGVQVNWLNSRAIGFDYGEQHIGYNTLTCGENESGLPDTQLVSGDGIDCSSQSNRWCNLNDSPRDIIQSDVTTYYLSSSGQVNMVCNTSLSTSCAYDNDCDAFGGRCAGDGSYTGGIFKYSSDLLNLETLVDDIAPGDIAYDTCDLVYWSEPWNTHGGSINVYATDCPCGTCVDNTCQSSLSNANGTSCMGTSMATPIVTSSSVTGGSQQLRPHALSMGHLCTGGSQSDEPCKVAGDCPGGSCESTGKLYWTDYQYESLNGLIYATDTVRSLTSPGDMIATEEILSTGGLLILDMEVYGDYLYFLGYAPEPDKVEKSGVYRLSINQEEFEPTPPSQLMTMSSVMCSSNNTYYDTFSACMDTCGNCAALENPACQVAAECEWIPGLSACEPLECTNTALKINSTLFVDRPVDMEIHDGYIYVSAHATNTDFSTYCNKMRDPWYCGCGAHVCVGGDNDEDRCNPDDLSPCPGGACTFKSFSDGGVILKTPLP
jgi:hypothetical protein